MKIPLVLLFCICLCHCTPNQGPLIAWGVNCGIPSISVSPSVNFTDVISTLKKNDKKLLIFVQSDLTVEDFALNENAVLKEIIGDKFKWVPSVLNPDTKIIEDTKVIQDIPISDKILKDSHVIYKLQGKDLATSVEEIKATLVNLKNSEFIAVIAGGKQIDEECSSKDHTSMRRILEVDLDEGKDDGVVFNISTQILMFTKQINFTVMKGKEVVSKNRIDLNETEVSGQHDNGTTASLVLKFPDLENITEFVMSMDFKMKFSQWSLKNFTVAMKMDQEKLEFELKNDISVPKGFSYSCCDSLFSSKSGTYGLKILIQKFQVQPFSVKENKFSRPYDCLGVLSVPIWMGLIVTIIFTLILLAGVSSLMSIKIMDKFDDPKGKTITINATD